MWKRRAITWFALRLHTGECGLRDYGLEPQTWDVPPELESCMHEWDETLEPGGCGTGESFRRDRLAGRDRGGLQPGFCQLCGAWRGSLGLEPTPELYVKHIVDIFREVKRVLRNDGTLWLNMGDSYASGKLKDYNSNGYDDPGWSNKQSRKPPEGYKPKDLIGIPWRVAFALQADGWYLRADIIWHKPNPMPESCTDRPTKSHEYLFLMSKKQKYFYDADAVREKAIDKGIMPRDGSGKNYNRTQKEHKPDYWLTDSNRSAVGRNKRSVWTIATRPFPEAHFATFPEKLIEPCILAGTSEKGCCVKCGAPWERVVEKGELINQTHDHKTPLGSTRGSKYDNRKEGSGWTVRVGNFIAGHSYESKTIGWRPGCKCYGTDPLPTYPKQGEDEPDEIYQERCEPIRLEIIRLCKLWAPLPAKPGVILDPFIGSCTTGIVAYRHDRKFIGIDLSEIYLKDIAIPRIERETEQLKLFN